MINAVTVVIVNTLILNMRMHICFDCSDVY